jgi:hypothetical protein
MVKLEFIIRHWIFKGRKKLGARHFPLLTGDKCGYILW